MANFNSSFNGTTITITPNVTTSPLPPTLALARTLTEFDNDTPLSFSSTGNEIDTTIAPNGNVRFIRNPVAYTITISVLAGGDDDIYLNAIRNFSKADIIEPLTFTIGLRKPNGTFITFLKAMFQSGTPFSGASGTSYNSNSYTFTAVDMQLIKLDE